MATAPQTVDLALGLGGDRPGVLCVGHDGQSTATETLVPLPASVYAIDIDPCRALLVCGTRGGMIHTINLGPEDDEQECRDGPRWLHGRPILSVCLVPDGGLLSADDSGQVLCWREGQQDAPACWTDGGPAICCLNAQHEAVVVGLGVDGGIFFWDSASGRQITRLAGPPPMSPFAVPRLTNWVLGTGVMMAYPTQDGGLAVIDVDPATVRVGPAHAGRWYAAFQLDDRLVTVGCDDGVARIWRWDDDGPVRDAEIEAFPGVTGADVTPAASPADGIAVLDNGGAVTFSMTEEGFRADAALPGDGYRVVATACDRLRRRNASDRQRHRATELREWIASSIESSDGAGLEEALGELEQLGYQSTSLDLQARWARQVGDDLAELEALHRLSAEWSESDPPPAWPSTCRYTELLLQYGQIELAADEMARLEPTDRSPRRGPDADGPRILARALRDGRTVVQPLIDGATPRLEDTIEAARILARPPTVAWELHRSSDVMLPGVRLDPERLAAALDACRDKRPEQVGVVTPRPLLWIRDGTAEEVGAIVIPLIAGADASGPARIALRVAERPAGTELSRSILLDLRSACQPRDCEQASKELLGLAARLQDAASRHALLAPINGWLFVTLRRICGSAAAACLNQPGDPQ